MKKTLLIASNILFCCFIFCSNIIADIQPPKFPDRLIEHFSRHDITPSSECIYQQLLANQNRGIDKTLLEASTSSGRLINIEIDHTIIEKIGASLLVRGQVENEPNSTVILRFKGISETIFVTIPGEKNTRLDYLNGVLIDIMSFEEIDAPCLNN